MFGDEPHMRHGGLGRACVCEPQSIPANHPSFKSSLLTASNGRAPDACRSLYWRSAAQTPHGASIGDWTAGAQVHLSCLMHWDRLVLPAACPTPREPSPRSHWKRYCDRSPELVNDHDFRSTTKGIAIPYGIYDTRANAGTVFVGQTADTPAFAVDCIEKWWRTEGRKHYPEANALQILADGGGSNSCTARAWKYNLQHRLRNPHGLRVTVASTPACATGGITLGERRRACHDARGRERSLAHTPAEDSLMPGASASPTLRQSFYRATTGPHSDDQRILLPTAKLV